MTEARILSMLLGIGTAVNEIRDGVALNRQALALMTETMRVLSARMEAVEKACTAEHPPSPLLEPLQALAAAASETNGILRDLGDAIDAQSRAIEAQPEAIQAAIEKALDGRGK